MTSHAAPFRIAVLGCTGYAAGELTLALEWVTSCRRPLDLFTIVSARVAPFARSAGGNVFTYRESAEFMLGDIQSLLRTLRPDMLVIADLILFYGCSCETVCLETLFETTPARCQIVGLDLYDWDLHVGVFDIWGGRRFDDPPVIPSRVTRLLPSPYLVPTRSTPGRGRYPMMMGSRPLSRRQRHDVRAQYGLGAGPVLLTLTSAWQYLPTEPHAARVAGNFLPLMLRLLDQAARRVGGVTLVHVGPCLLEIPEDVQAVRYLNVPQLSPAPFRRLLGGVDLVLTANCIAASAIRAASMQTPVAALYVGSAVQTPKQFLPATQATRAVEHYVTSTDPTYPFRVWPAGMFDVVNSILDRNPFATIERHLDVLDPDAVVDALTALLTNRAVVDTLRGAQGRYFANLSDAVDGADEALDAVLIG